MAPLLGSGIICYVKLICKIQVYVNIMTDYLFLHKRQPRRGEIIVANNYEMQLNPEGVALL